MAFKQSSNPLSRNTSPMRRSPFRQQTMSMDELNKASAASQEQSRINSQSGTAGAPGDPGTEINYDDPRKFAGDDEGMLQSNFEPQFPGDDGYEDQGMSRKESPLNVEGGKAAHTKSTSQKADFAWETHKQGSHHKLKLGQKTAKPSEEEIAVMSEENSKGVSRQDPKYFGLGKDDGTGRKIKKANKTAGQIVKMQNKRSSVKNVYLGDPDDLEGEMVRTADKPASKREVRKIKKFKKTKNQLGEKAVSPLNVDAGTLAKGLVNLEKDVKSGKRKETGKAREPRKKVSAAIASTLKSNKVVNKKIEPKTEKVVIKKTITGTPDGKTAKDRGIVDKSGREGNNRQERKKRRAERKSIRKDKTLSSSQKKMAKKESRDKQKENVRGIKKKVVL